MTVQHLETHYFITTEIFQTVTRSRVSFPAILFRSVAIKITVSIQRFRK